MPNYTPLHPNCRILEIERQEEFGRDCAVLVTQCAAPIAAVHLVVPHSVVQNFRRVGFTLEWNEISQ